MKTISFATLDGLKRSEGGLSASDVSLQRSRFGSNDITEVTGNPWLELSQETLKDPMIWFLVGIGAAFLAIGERGDAITLFVAVLPLLLMDAFLHWRTQASTAMLKGQLSSRVSVLRGSKEIEINSRELVPGDAVLIQPGLLLPADGVFESAKDIQVDESVLTGESLPIAKAPAGFDPFTLSTTEKLKVPPEILGCAGTRILTGRGVMRVLFTGTHTAYGEIVQSVARMPHERTPLQKSISHLVRVLVLAALALCFLLAGIRIYQGHGWLDALLSAATLAVAAIPEEFPVVFTFFLGVGIYRLAKKRALVRRAVSVENIGRVTQICTDKTGTLTAGQLRLAHFDLAPGKSVDSILRAALIASGSTSDPVDAAIQEVANEKRLPAPPRLQTIPFTEDRKRETGFSNAPGEDLTLACVKGAPETVLAMSNLSDEQRSSWRSRVAHWARSGHKVLACAQMAIANADDQFHPLQEPLAGFEFCGLLAFEDPVRPEVAEAMAYCHKNGIRVLMITGDHPDTATAIAKDANLAKLQKEAPRVISADDEPEKFSEEWLNQNPNFLKTVDVVARCNPLQKLTIVTALKRAGELVAVTGDGVNDVPALKAADIGIAMGERGTRSAKEVSSIILGDDNFTTIVNAIREGRQLFKNLEMSFEYLLLVHIPLVSTAALVPLTGYPLLYLPVHIVWLELVIHPTALLAFQSSAASHDEEPRTRLQTFFSKRQIYGIGLAGGLVALGLTWTFLSGVNEGLDVAHARSKAMALLTFWSAGVAVYLTRFRSPLANILAASTVAASIVLIQSSGALAFLHLGPIHLRDWLEASSIVGGLITAMGAFAKNQTHR